MPDVVRLSVNLAPSVSDALKEVAKDNAISVTEATRRAIALLALQNTAAKAGHRIMVVEGTGLDATYREVLFP